MNTLKYNTLEETQAAIEQFNSLLGFPDEKSDTLTYCDVPEPSEDGTYELPVTNELDKLLNPEVYVTEPVGNNQ